MPAQKATPNAAEETTRGAAKGLQPSVTAVNEVRIVGTVQSDPQVRQMPSGDELLVLRVSVERPASARRSSRSPRYDVFEVNCFTASTRKAACRLREGQAVEVLGAMRRRVRRVDAGAMVRMELEAMLVRTGRSIMTG